MNEERRQVNIPMFGIPSQIQCNETEQNSIFTFLLLYNSTKVNIECNKIKIYKAHSLTGSQ